MAPSVKSWRTPRNSANRPREGSSWSTPFIIHRSRWPTWRMFCRRARAPGLNGSKTTTTTTTTTTTGEIYKSSALRCDNDFNDKSIISYAFIWAQSGRSKLRVHQGVRPVDHYAGDYVHMCSTSLDVGGMSCQWWHSDGIRGMWWHPWHVMLLMTFVACHTNGTPILINSPEENKLTRLIYIFPRIRLSTYPSIYLYLPLIIYVCTYRPCGCIQGHVQTETDGLTVMSTRACGRARTHTHTYVRMMCTRTYTHTQDLSQTFLSCVSGLLTVRIPRRLTSLLRYQNTGKILFSEQSKTEISNWWQQEQHQHGFIARSDVMISLLDS